MDHRMRFAVVAVASLVAIAHSRPALAATVISPVGPIDSSCVIEVPNGATIDERTGGPVTVSLNGSVLATYAPCTGPKLPLGPSLQGSGGGSAAQWYEWTWTSATQVAGLEQFNKVVVEWTVPASGPSDSTVLYLFPGFVDCQNPSSLSTCTTFGALVQPILQWGYNENNGGHYWLAEGAVYTNSGKWLYLNPCTNLPAGDTVEGFIQQIAGSPDEWEVAIEDADEGCFSYYDYYPPSSAPKFNALAGGVLEGYGSAVENQNGVNPIPSCSDLPSSAGEFFDVLAITQAGPVWNDFNNVFGQQSWADVTDCASNDPFCFSPTNCSWGALASDNWFGEGYEGTEVGWQQ